MSIAAGDVLALFIWSYYPNPGGNQATVHFLVGEGQAQLTAAGLVFDVPSEPLGEVYLTSTPLGEQRQTTDCGSVPSYAMVREAPDPGKAYAALSEGAAPCPTSFVFPMTADVTLTGDAEVHLIVACDQPTTGGRATGGSTFAFRLSSSLTNDGQAANAVRTRQGNDVCTEEPASLRVKVPTNDLHLGPGDFLVLHIGAYYATGPPDTAPNLHFIVGDGKSLLRAAGLEALAKPYAPVDAGPPIFLSNSLLEHRYPGAPCPGRTYALSTELGPDAFIPLGRAEPTGGCPAFFRFIVLEPFPLEAAAATVWTDCPQGTLLLGIAAWIERNEQRISDQAGTARGETGGSNVCNDEPRSTTLNFALHKPVHLEAEDALSLAVFVGGANPPEDLSLVRLLVGGEFPSQMLNVLPAMVTEPEAAQKSPAPFWALPLAIILGKIFRRRQPEGIMGLVN